MRHRCVATGSSVREPPLHVPCRPRSAVLSPRPRLSCARLNCIVVCWCIVSVCARYFLVWSDGSALVGVYTLCFQPVRFWANTLASPKYCWGSRSSRSGPCIASRTSAVPSRSTPEPQDPVFSLNASTSAPLGPLNHSKALVCNIPSAANDSVVCGQIILAGTFPRLGCPSRAVYALRGIPHKSGANYWKSVTRAATRLVCHFLARPQSMSMELGMISSDKAYLGTKTEDSN
ncbi:Piso0_005254 [Millerozyma farinosa CBS 7064]|uniref:Piso0_005254 protein n=1 Tax=Pichia sorbitophila (strain ATCC MYA-4447 / BCRC 22081 / CBS 7064 / NBRC 10061 / NRRL Y-12695) TaxID=559304 RepID=G8Y1P1_PICSO|nr:Piso0_005254 [Millerozyma farinosa CBS 7064]